MNNIKLLDCTLRDGGYINDWLWGEDCIKDIYADVVATNVDIVELGFIRNVEYNPGRAVFSSMQQAQSIMSSASAKYKKKPLTAVMAEISNPIPSKMVESSENNDIDLIRVIVWKSRRNAEGVFVDALNDSYNYCKELAEKGYKLCIQPNRSNQYSDEEFQDMLKKFADLSPMAIYVVDSWGTMYADDVIHYMEMADKVLPADTAIGFHGHNNMQQAFSNAESVIERKFSRTIILDASVYGIGRGAGNLPLELIARYLNKKHGKEYNLEPILKIYDSYIKELRKKYTWGSSMSFFMSSDADANPDYAPYFEGKESAVGMKKIFSQMSYEERLIFSRAKAEKYLQMN